ncbi:PQQ-dependent sugar dehydrogenase [Gynuella sunshinyii]|uniref:Glucose/sorbosone dehydrogenase n=1 Tax=Gynuella sunshinyii YC6258 TaxID=1445510 RepID=A0A0C5VPS7_9GAMM|nr:PQQ-dependent sugar dehydrogenase [Gynuella sunshinyii]AJQ96226.1 glucose/sorbosone dehydrogenase [Gynuella sunshinyii YC6258]
MTFSIILYGICAAARADLPSGPPVPTPPPNAKNQTPAFPQQTRAPEVHSDFSIQLTQVANGLNHPWALQFLPDGKLLLTERSGNLRLITQDGQMSAPLQGLPEVFTSGQGGLLDVNISPDFDQDRLVYFSYSEPREHNKNATAVARGRLNETAAVLENVEVIFRQQPAWESHLHFGSRLVWNKSGNLFVTLGERSLPKPRQLAQDTNTHLGKVIQIKADGSIPGTNPFIHGGGQPEIWSYGHRNPQGAAIHPLTGELWTIEHGPRGGDELNTPEAGKNYGWPVITYGIDYSGAPIGNGITQQPGMEQPRYYWDPVIAPGGMTFYQGPIFPEWNGNLLISSLNPGGIVRVMIQDHQVIGEERLATNVGRIRDLTTDHDGYIWFVTDADNGSLYKVSRTTP